VATNLLNIRIRHWILLWLWCLFSQLSIKLLQRKFVLPVCWLVDPLLFWRCVHPIVFWFRVLLLLNMSDLFRKWSVWWNRNRFVSLCVWLLFVGEQGRFDSADSRFDLVSNQMIIAFSFLVSTPLHWRIWAHNVFLLRNDYAWFLTLLIAAWNKQTTLVFCWSFEVVFWRIMDSGAVKAYIYFLVFRIRLATVQKSWKGPLGCSEHIWKR
jgi:hypothetical protein